MNNTKTKGISSGSIIYMTKRKLTLNPRSWLSNIIHLLFDKWVHTGIIFEYKGIQYVRDMEWFGTRFTPLDLYLERYKGRIEIRVNPFTDDFRLARFNIYCKHVFASYGYFGLFFIKPIQLVFGRLINIIYPAINNARTRICWEDTCRCYNTLKSYYFPLPETITSKEMYDYTNNWFIFEL